MGTIGPQKIKILYYQTILRAMKLGLCQIICLVRGGEMVLDRYCWSHCNQCLYYSKHNCTLLSTGQWSISINYFVKMYKMIHCCYIINMKIYKYINILSVSYCTQVLLSYTSCGRLRSMLGRGDIMVWLVVEAGSAEDCTAGDKELPSTTYAGWTARRAGSIATTTCATFPDVFSNVDECWLTTKQQMQSWQLNIMISICGIMI